MTDIDTLKIGIVFGWRSKKNSKIIIQGRTPIAFALWVVELEGLRELELCLGGLVGNTVRRGKDMSKSERQGGLWHWEHDGQTSVVGTKDLIQNGVVVRLETHWSLNRWAWNVSPGLICVSDGLVVPRHFGLRNFSPS